ncbi:MAG TPA: adenylate/guanylate cyclase domain-containing protein [Candidatus Limnocylindrales bacterium]|nr:adenylate/guanylate cyclase domain-containing protein [Candidatus Limnocylindrales bacterium]
MAGIRYARSGDVHVAYAVEGDGPVDLVFVSGWVSHLEMIREEPRAAQFFDRLASFSKLIRFDKRGTGLSDRVVGLPDLETRMDDVRAVMDAAGSQRAFLFGVSEGGPMSCLFAATYPERVIGLVLYGSYARRTRTDDYPWAPTIADREAYFAQVEREWGSDMDVADRAPTGDRAFQQWYARFNRAAASPAAAAALARMNSEVDVREVLPTIRVPALVLHRTAERLLDVGGSRYIASRIPGAKLVELPGGDHIPYLGDADRLLDEVEEFVTGTRPAPQADRVLVTILFTDIVGSTALLDRLGDRSWRQLLDRYQSVLRGLLRRYRGEEIDTAGDGFFALFDGPARAIRCAVEIRDAIRPLGLEARFGVHTGEVERSETAARGIAVHLGARIMALADAGQVLVSSTTRDLVAGSGIVLEARGDHRLKGIPEPVRVYAATGAA